MSLSEVVEEERRAVCGWDRRKAFICGGYGAGAPCHVSGDRGKGAGGGSMVGFMTLRRGRRYAPVRTALFLFHQAIVSMASSFPALLARTKFATFDPLVSRVYTSPSASRGDWGLKYTLPSSTAAHPRPKYLRVLSLDAPGQGLDCDYRSGEKEARFMERWGDGRHGWFTREEHEFQVTDEAARGHARVQRKHASAGVRPKKGTSLKELKADDDDKVASARQDVLDASAPFMPDIQAMSEKRFNAYLEELRARRSDHARHLDPAGGNLLRAAVSPRRMDKQHSRFIADAKMSALKDRASSEIVPSPHELFGLAYSKPVSGTSIYTDPTVIQRETSPLTAYPGRALPADVGRDTYQRHKDLSAARGRNIKNDYVIGIGGLTAGMARGSNNGYSNEGLDTQFDHTRTDKSRGVSTFRVKSAALLSPPRIILSSATGKRDPTPLSVNQTGFTAGAKQFSPLDTFKYDMQVYASRQADARRKEVNKGALVPGEPGWVGMKPQTNRSAGDYLAGGRADTAALLARRPSRAGKNQQVLSTEISKIMDQINRGKTRAAGRAFSTSARRWAADLPTADPAKAVPTDNNDISGPGFGKKEKSDGPAEGVAQGEWRQLEENVGGEVRYGEPRAQDAKKPAARSFTTSARQLSDKPKDNDLPTADPAKALPQGTEISGPGFGEKDAGGLAEGDWRQLEENVGGEVRYGEPKGQEGKKEK